jgi:hypothetical protein
MDDMDDIAVFLELSEIHSGRTVLGDVTSDYQRSDRSALIRFAELGSDAIVGNGLRAHLRSTGTRCRR